MHSAETGDGKRTDCKARSGFGSTLLHGLNDRTQPRRADGVDRESGTEGASRRWLQ
jgi:hypothetical protein